MKPVVFIIIGFIYSFSISAQNSPVPKELPEINTDTSWQRDTNNSLSVIPGYKPYILPGYNFNSNIPENELSEYLNTNNLITRRYLQYNFEMPVAKGGSAVKMPVVVPDSTVHYYIKELRIEIIPPELRK